MGQDGYKLVELANGGSSIHSLAHGETFHPVIGPAAEAEALYVRQLDLRAKFRERGKEFVVWDVGLGAAANPLTILRSTVDIPALIRVVSFDNTTEPLTFALQHSGALGYLDGYEDRLRQLIECGKIDFSDGAQRVRWSLHLGDFPALLRTLLQARSGDFRDALPAPDVILFDAFSPAKNPAMWTLPLFTNLFHLLDPGRPCVMPTYSRSTMLRVTLLLAGFFVGAGHATGEKEETTIAANHAGLICEPLDLNWLTRAEKSTSAEPLYNTVYRQAPLAAATLEKLKLHPQFQVELG